MINLNINHETKYQLAIDRFWWQFSLETTL